MLKNSNLSRYTSYIFKRGDVYRTGKYLCTSKAHGHILIFVFRACNALLYYSVTHKLKNILRHKSIFSYTFHNSKCL